MLLLSREDIQKVFSMKDAILAVEDGFRLFSDNKVCVPLRTVIPAEDTNGTFLFMPAYCAQLGCASMKIINIFPDNRKKGLSTFPAQVLLLDAENGMPVASLDGTYVTQLRTGAASGAALKWLARQDCEKGALIGAGGQARTQLLAMLEARSLKEVAVFDPYEALCREFVEQMNVECAGKNVRITCAASGNAAVQDADVIITVTPSKQPVFDGGLVKPGVTISAVGSYKPDMEEIDPVLVQRAARIYCDSTEAVLAEAGDVIIPLHDGTITMEKFAGDLGQLLNGSIPGRKNDGEILLFETVGIGIQDLITAKRIYDAAQAAAEPVGYQWG